MPEPADPQTEEERDANLFRHGAPVLFGAPVFGPADPVRVEPAPTPVPRQIGLADVAQVMATTERLGQLASDLGGIPMTDALTVHVRVGEALLGAAMSESVRQRLLIAVSDAHRAAGGTAESSGLRDLARQHYIRSMDCARAGGDLLRVVVSVDSLGRMELRDAAGGRRCPSRLRVSRPGSGSGCSPRRGMTRSGGVIPGWITRWARRKGWCGSPR